MFFKIIFLVLILSMPFTAQITYNHDSITVSEVKQKVDFHVLVPEDIPDDWTLEIKTYPWEADTNFTHFRLHFMDKSDTIFKVGIEQKKSTTHKEDHLYANAEEVAINDHIGLFISWGNTGERDDKGEIITGGLLRWTQDGTFIEMNSTRISKKEMLTIARSMKVANE
ncbi:hypothetical protein FIU87_03185 [Bacillus sp. THAF10]|uniref:DUF4367 domain-containing protein n=1 Tax=Bacillus sp. THAF10 TaxID=2587848 RepID=UPI0012AA7733|nr:DUF4367 domain-containing protein [Bacillus sp. THAF10]QFT87645.1 hypothetical protein FIU87_03185 [Bacillus sp. THAF10]